MADRSILVQILGDAKNFNKATQSATASAGKFGSVMQGMAQGVGIGAFLGIANGAAMAGSAIVNFVGDSIRAASNLNETVTKSTVIYGRNSDAVIAWSKTTADSMGLSQRAALDAASGFAGLFKVVGLSLDESTAMSQKITGLGADLASFFNTDMATALAALKSGLNGEAEPLRQFNVFLSETAVSAKLAQMGVQKVGGQFTEAQKATARYKLIMEQTGDAQGDFARTSDGLANSSRTLDAKIEDLQAKLGKMLTPALEDAIAALSDFVTEIGKTGGAADDLANIWSDLIAQFGTDPWYQQKSSLGEFLQTLDGVISDSIDFMTPWDTYVSKADQRKAAMDEHAASIARITQTISPTIVAMKDQEKQANQTAGSIRRDNTSVNLSYAALASYLLGKYNTDYDKALTLQETRATLHKTKSDADRVAAYATLEGLGANSQKDYANWLAALERLAKGTKGAIHQAYMDAIEDVNRLRQRIAAPFNLFVEYHSSYSTQDIHNRASGGPAKGLTWVGETGPELLDLPGGSHVYSAGQSRALAMRRGGGDVHVHIDQGAYIDGPSIDRLTNLIAQRLNYARGV